MKKGWEVKNLGNVSQIIYGYTEKASISEIGPKFLRITDIQNNDVKWETVPFCKIDSLDYAKYKLNAGDIVFARTGATTGKSYLINSPPKSVFASYLIKVHIENNTLLPNFLFLFFQTKNYWDVINAGISGSAQGGFNATKLAKLEIPIPPLSEQKRIIKILDKAFAAIEKAKENAEKNLQNTRELFESYLQGVFANPDDGWEKKKLGKIANIEYGFTDKAKDMGNYRYIRITDIDKNGDLEKENKMFINFLEEAKRFLLKDDDLLMARTGATYAKVLLYKNLEKSVFASYLIRISFKVNIINKLYWYFSKSRIYWDQANKLSSGSAQPQFNGGALKELIFCFPKSLLVQNRIIAKLDTLSAETKKLEAIYQQKIADSEELKKSILQKAFNGEL